MTTEDLRAARDRMIREGATILGERVVVVPVRAHGPDLSRFWDAVALWVALESLRSGTDGWFWSVRRPG